LRGLTSKSDTIYTNTHVNGPKLVQTCLGNNRGNFQLHSFTTSENIAKKF